MTASAQATPGAGPAVVDGVDLDALAAAVRGCSGVDDLVQGAWGGVVTYLPGRPVPGIRVTGDRVVISVRGRWGVPAGELARQIRLALTALVGSHRIDIIVADVADDPAAAADEVSSWTTSSGAGPGAPISGPVTPTAVATSRLSSPG